MPLSNRALITTERLRRALNLQVLRTPGAPTLTPTGGAEDDSTPYSYALTAYDALMETPASAIGSTTTGAASLDTDHFNRLSWTAVTAAQGYRVYRTAGGTSQGLLATISDPTTTGFDDTGFAGDGSTAPSDPDEQLLEGYIDAACEQLEALTGRVLASRSGLDVALDGSGTPCVQLRLDGRLAWPTTSLDALTLYTADFSQSQVIDVSQDAGEVALDPERGTLRLLASAPWRCFPCGAGTVVVSFTAGLDPIMHPAARALLEIAARSCFQWLFQGRERDPALSFVTVNPSGVTLQYQVTNSPALLPPHLKNLLRSFMSYAL